MSVIKIKTPKIVASFGASKAATSDSATQLIDTAATFATQGVQAGDLIYKYIPASGDTELFVVDTVVDENTITFATNAAGFLIGDKYVIVRPSETMTIYLEPENIEYFEIMNSSALGSFIKLIVASDDSTENEYRIFYYRKSDNVLTVGAVNNEKMANQFIKIVDESLRGSYTKETEFTPTSDIGMLFYKIS
jgi:hypothetical protein|tara:strand:- start:4341 stop:4916 length:576 start_codon:yes stop_codon:yes gene_type:complete